MPQFIYAYVYAIVYVYGMYSPLPAVIHGTTTRHGTEQSAVLLETQRCFDMIKRICYKTPILRPIDYRSEEPVWLICDTSKMGVGAMYGQGPTWNTCRPARFMSKKFMYAQQHYTVHELETLAILKALQKWEDKLIGRRLHIITDHKALEFFKTQAYLSSRQQQWMDYMSKFDFNITYIKGEYNKVADCLSRYYENDTSADVHLWVVICRMTSMVHLIPVTTRITAKELSWEYLTGIVKLHSLPSLIVSDRDSKFTSKWWRELHRLLGAKLLMSTSFHPQTDGQSERAIWNITQILWAVVWPDQRDWCDKIPMTEFAINASVSKTTGYAPFELNGGYMLSMLEEIRNNEGIVKGIKEFTLSALMNLADAHDAIIEARTFQMERANKRRRQEPAIAVGNLVYLLTKT